MLITTMYDMGLATRQRRDALGLSQHDLAERAGVSGSWLAKVEAGKEAFDVRRALMVLNAMGLHAEVGMFALLYTAFRNNMKAIMRKFHDDADVMLVTNRDPADSVVVMSQDDYDALMETLRVQSNPDLHRRVLSGMRQTAEGTEEEYAEL